MKDRMKTKKTEQEELSSAELADDLAEGVTGGDTVIGRCGKHRKIKKAGVVDEITCIVRQRFINSPKTDC